MFMCPLPHKIPSPGGKVSAKLTDEELGRQQQDFTYAKTKQICPHSSSVTACAVPPSPREKVYALRNDNYGKQHRAEMTFSKIVDPVHFEF